MLLYLCVCLFLACLLVPESIHSSMLHGCVKCASSDVMAEIGEQYSLYMCGLVLGVSSA